MPPPFFRHALVCHCLALAFFTRLVFATAFYPCRGIQSYLITFDYNWSPDTDLSFPTTDNSIDPGFSPLICASHSPDFNLWQQNAPISLGVRTLLTNVSNEGIEEELKQAQQNNTVLQYIAVSDDNITAISTTFLAISVNGDGNFTLISCIAKVIPSADWFVGLSRIDTCLHNRTFMTSRSGSLFGWDGGIDNSEAYDERLPLPTSEAVQVLPALLAAPEGYGLATVRATQLPTPTPSSQSPTENDSNSGKAQPPQPVIPNEVPNQMQEVSEPDDMVCIDAAALEHLPSTSMLYAEHRLARVLCDPYASCATAGHMVYFRNVPMMMNSYCRLTQCTKHLMYVNSPRYSRALRISSKTPDLEYTALAARHTTTVEEYIMSIALRIGL